MLIKNFLRLIIIIPILFFSITISYLFLYPDDNKNDDSLSQSDGSLPYNVFYPDKTIELPDELTEISGISYYDKNTIACIEDESGTIYLLNVNTGKITGTHVFRKDGDFEDIEVVEDDKPGDMKMKIYILRSNGKIYRIKRLGLNNQKVKEYETFLKREHDAEGLCYFKNMNALLIACKGSLSPDGNQLNNPGVEDKRAVYVFDLNEKKILPEPLFVFSTHAVKDKSGKVITINDQFQPSGISIHPKTNNIYIISSVGKLLIVINAKGEIISLTKLNKNMFRQPEGICFFPNGDLFISNEGRHGKGNIVQFSYKR